MWSDRTSDDRGYTLVEVMITLAISAVLMLALFTFLHTSVNVNRTLEATTLSDNAGAEALADIRWTLSASARILDRGAGGDDYVGLIDLTGAPALLPGSRLPRIAAGTSLSPGNADFDSEVVGNALLLVEQMTPFTDTKSKRRIDRYRFVYFYLSNTGAGVAQLDPIVEMFRFESVVYADFTQMDSLEKEDAAAMAAALRAAGVTHVWDADAPAEAAFSRVGVADLVRPPDANHAIKMAKYVPQIPDLGLGEKASGYMGMSIAHNSGEDFPIGTVVPRFARATAAGFPGGFEVVIAGPTRGRKVMLRLVVAAWAGGRLYSRESMLLVAVSD